MCLYDKATTMKKNVTILFFLILIFSCDNKEIETIELLNGTYTGLFYRASPGVRYQSSDVTLTFSQNEFHGTSSISKYPAICNGTYKLIGQKIEFINLCPWTAEFDWSYILSGEFKITKIGDDITMIKSYSDAFHDTYRITRK
jgi:hypothetical protein